MSRNGTGKVSTQVSWKATSKAIEHHPLAQKGSFKNIGLSAENLVLPIFVSDSRDANLVQAIDALPGQYKFGTSSVVDYLQPLVNSYDLKAIILFGVVERSTSEFKDTHGNLGDAVNVDLGSQTYTNPVILAMRNIKHAFGEKLIIIADVCLCSYTSNGHCGIMKLGSDGLQRPEAELSHQRLAEVAVSYAEHGADIIAPSDMIIGRIGPMRRALDSKGFSSVPIMSYALKYCSAFYGPFRSAVASVNADGENPPSIEAQHSEFPDNNDMHQVVRASMLPSLSVKSPAPYIDRSTYQLHPMKNAAELLQIAQKDVQDGAEYLMVKPSTCYLDILQQASSQLRVPFGVYHTSGEYCQLYYAANRGALDLSSALEEVCLAFVRSGAKFIISYFTPFILMKLKE
uniref:porphobilinogen synthase n=1 Tax=Perkinsela sp. SMB-60 TaxID=1840652 RepID=A0A167HCT7_9EUGL|nr:delta-aminolevulinic acid dehydratase/porphobilinogen synthase [Perkinsela sp. SMB-60]